MKKVKHTSAFIVIFWLCISEQALAQTANPDAIRQCGENLRTTAYNALASSYNFRLDETNRTDWCRHYSNWRKSNSSANIVYKYLDFSASNAEAKAIYELECKETNYSRDIGTSTRTAVRSIDPAAIAAYQSCLNLAKGGVSVKIDDYGKKQIGVTLTAYAKNKVNRVDVIGSGKVKCTGSLADASKKWFGLSIDEGKSKGMTCIRTENEAGAIEDVVIQVEVEEQEPWRHGWKGRGSCGTRGQVSCNGTVAVQYTTRFPEHSGGYDTARAPTATARSSALRNRVASEVPSSCTSEEAANAIGQLREQVEQEWSTVIVSDSRGHSCTKGSSGGTKDCGCKETKSAPSGFESKELGRSGGIKKASWVGTKAQICQHKSGKGRIGGTVTATWKLGKAVVNQRSDNDVAYMRSISACFNGCKVGLKPDQAGVCR